VPDEKPTVIIDGTRELNAQPSAIFAVISNHRALPRWIPGLRRVDLDESPSVSPHGIGTRRTLRMFLGPAGVEVITAFEPPSLLSYSATDESLRGLCTNHTAELSCTASARGTLLRWRVQATLPRSWWRRLLTALVFRTVCRAGLRNLSHMFIRPRVMP
jgi:hypothetical protein